MNNGVVLEGAYLTAENDDQDDPGACAICGKPKVAVCHSCWKNFCALHLSSDGDECVECHRRGLREMFPPR